MKCCPNQRTVHSDEGRQAKLSQLTHTLVFDMALHLGVFAWRDAVQGEDFQRGTGTNVSRLLTSAGTARHRRTRHGSRRGERPPPPRRPARREAEGGSCGGYSSEHQGTKGVKPSSPASRQRANTARQPSDPGCMEEKSREFTQKGSELYAKA